MSFEKQTLGERAHWSAVLVVALGCGCGPYHEGSSGGSAGEGAPGGAPSAGSGGAGSAGDSNAAGGSLAGSAGIGAGGSTAGSSTAGSAGAAAPSAEPVVGCPAASWPDAGFYYEAPPALGEGGVEPSSAAVMLAEFSARAMSGDGKVVVGMSRNPDSEISRPVPASFTLADGAALLASAPPSGESYPYLASCDGSVVVQQEIHLGEVFRSEGTEVLPLFTYPADHSTLSMDPTGARIVDGTGQAGYSDETGIIPPVPQVWTAATGTVWERELTDLRVFHVSADGTLIGADANALFRYDPSTHTREPIGMAPVAGATSIAVSANGNAWIESADTHSDSFLAWRLPAEPRSVTCPAYCTPVDVSGTGAVALIDVGLDTQDSPSSSWLWTERDGLVELTELFEQHGVDPGGGRKLRAVALSDDARAFTGYSFDPVDPFGTRHFFYAVLPIAAYE